MVMVSAQLQENVVPSGDGVEHLVLTAPILHLLHQHQCLLLQAAEHAVVEVVVMVSAQLQESVAPSGDGVEHPLLTALVTTDEKN